MSSQGESYVHKVQTNRDREGRWDIITFSERRYLNSRLHYFTGLCRDYQLSAG